VEILKSAIAEYEDVLIGGKKVISAYYFSYNASGNMKLALQIMKYAFDTYLHWSAEQLRDYLTLKVMERLKLQPLIRHIIFPVELDCNRDLFYIAWLLYPKTVHFSEKELILRVYKNLLDRKIQKYPKEFFDGMSGYRRAQVCLRYMVEQFVPVSTIDALYEFFASPDCYKVLRQKKLLVVCRDWFASPVDYLHQSLPKEQQNNFLYYYFSFRQRRAEQKAQLAEQSAAGKAGDTA